MEGTLICSSPMMVPVDEKCGLKNFWLKSTRLHLIIKTSSIFSWPMSQRNLLRMRPITRCLLVSRQNRLSSHDIFPLPPSMVSYGLWPCSLILRRPRRKRGWRPPSHKQGPRNALIFKRALCQPRNFITSSDYILYYFFLDTQYILIYLGK